MYSNIAIMKTDKYCYPKTGTFRPSEKYPEYIFGEQLSSEENNIYSLIRDGFFELGYDAENYGTANWNPLKEIVKPGDVVLLKPNLVMDVNLGGGRTECLYTQPAIVAAVIDYVALALAGKGTIIVGDAPMQECNFDKLVSESGYDRLISFYKANLSDGIRFDFLDFREVTSVIKQGMHYHSSVDGKGVTIDLGKLSEHYGESEDTYRKYRITNYDPSILRKHHNSSVHEYRVNKNILNADVIINLPKPKTHRKAGVTIALKNLVGINARKEFLPHHTNGSICEGGDEYKDKSMLKKLLNFFLDKQNESSQGKHNYVATRFFYGIVRVLNYARKKCSHDPYFEGSWYGNDTISKTIVDLNKILLYADRNGVIKDVKQRKNLIIADMIISGEKEGPVLPSPKNVGVIAIGENPVCFDEAIATLMGAKLEMISTIQHARNPKGGMDLVDKDTQPYLISNDERYNGKTIESISSEALLYFEPTSGWKSAFMKKTNK